MVMMMKRKRYKQNIKLLLFAKKKKKLLKRRETRDPSGDYQQFQCSDEPLVLLLNSNSPRGRNAAP